MERELSRQFTFKAGGSELNELSKIPNSLSQTINQECFAKQKGRRHKIFQQSKLFSQQRYKTEKKTREPIYERDQRRSTSKVQTPAEAKEQKVMKIQDAINQEMPFSSSYKEMIQMKLSNQRIADLYDGTKEKLAEKLAKKEQEIKVLRLQIERSKRCEDLNKTNEELYRRLIDKMKENSTEIIAQSSKRYSHQAVHTPIHSLTEIRFTPDKPMNKDPSPREVQPESVAARLNLTEPLKTIPQKEENQLMTENNAETLNFHSATRGTSKRHIDPSKGSPINTKSHEADPIYLKLQSQLNASRNRCRLVFNDLPVSLRLKEMNRALETSFNEQRRVSQRHSSHRKQKHNSMLQSSYYQGRQ